MIYNDTRSYPEEVAQLKFSLVTVSNWVQTPGMRPLTFATSDGILPEPCDCLEE